MLRELRFFKRVLFGRSICAASLVIGFLFVQRAPAQTTGALQGTVTDEQSAVVAGASLTLVNNATRVQLRQESGPNGTYFFNSVPPGSYTLTVSSTGFKETAYSNVRIEVNKATSLNPTLSLGTVTQSVDVSGQAQQIDTTTAQVSTNVGQKEILTLPNFNRSALDFANLAPGVSVGGDNIQGGSQVMNVTGMIANVNGNRMGRNNFYLDGMDNTAAFRNNGLQFPNPDAVQEVQVSTSNTSAEQGRQIGGVFNVITKSGSNDFHGNAYFFLRPPFLSANSWDRNRNGLDRYNDKWKQGGGTLGGPLWRNHTFFFISYMRYQNNSNGLVTNKRGVTSAMQNGDFSELLSPSDPSLIPVQLYDPASRIPIANNQIPATLIDPVGQKLFNMVPTVPRWGDYYVWSYQQPVQNNEVLSRIDHHISDKHTIALNLLHTFGDGTYPATAAGLNTLPSYPGEVDSSNQWTVSAHETWIARPNLIVDGSFGWTRQLANRGMQQYGGTLASLGAQNFPDVEEGARPYPAGFNVAGSGVSASQGYLSDVDQHNYQFSGKLTWIHNAHSIKFGADMQRAFLSQFDDHDGLNFGFDGRFLGLAEGQNQVGAAFADLLAGRSTGFGQNGILNYALFNWNHFFFAEDTWKVTRKLTLTPGLRYEFYLPAHEQNRKMTTYIAGYRSSVFPTAPVGLAFPGDPGVPSGFFHTDWTNLAPRIGAAYDIKGDSTWAIRAGFGKYFSYNAMQIKMWNAENNPWHPSAGCSENIVSNPWLTCQSVNYAQPPTPFTSSSIAGFNWPPFIGQAIGYQNNFKTPYSYQWNVALEHQLSRYISAQAAYVANSGHALTELLPVNYAPYAPDADQTGSNINARRPVQGYGDIEQISSVAKSSYRSLQTVLNFRYPSFTSTITYVLQRAYGWASEDPFGQSSQTANPLCVPCENAEQAGHHVFRTYFSWDLPFLTNYQNLASKILGGWQLSGAITAQTGSPQNVVIGQDWNYDGISGDRPDVNGSIQYVRRDLGNGFMQWIDVGNSNSNASQRGPFSLPEHATFGNLKRNAVFGPGSWDADLAVMKNFHITERQYFQFRLETYNLFNHPNLYNPDLTYFDSTFGQISGRSGNRQMQVGLKYYF